MTYLEVVNNVLCRLRGQSVSSVQSTTYSKMIGQLVNDAKRIVEDGFRWSVLFNTQTVTSVAGTEGYDLSSTNNRSLVFSVLATDGTKTLQPLTPQEFQYRKYARYKNQQGQSEFFKTDANGTGGLLKLYMLPTPDRAVEYTVLTHDPQDNLGDTDDNTTIKVPWEPIALRAYAYALKERGEDEGFSSEEALEQYEQSMGRAINVDSQNAPAKLWQVV